MTLNIDSFSTTVNFDGSRIHDIDSDLLVYDRQMASAVHGIQLPPGGLGIQADEQHKNWNTVSEILQELLDRGVARDGLLIAVGGGVLCDVAAFASSIYMRGISCILMPTTLLSMVDAAFGGKTGMNFGGYKNMVGTFHPASELIIQADFLKSLPFHELQSGLGEVFKAALLAESDLWGILKEKSVQLMQHDRTDNAVWHTDKLLWERIIKESLTIKGRIVEADFRESGQRAFLNLGHTFGHAAESVLGFGSVPHGTLVVWGILCALRLGVLIKKTDQNYYIEVEELARKLAYPVKIQLPEGKTIDDLVSAMRSDKKKRGGQVRFVLQRGPADNFQEAVDENLLRQTLIDAVIS